MRIITDNEKCIGCLACVVTCMDHHYDVNAQYPVPLRRYKRIVKESGLTQYITESCRHCAEAPCMKVCPRGAIRKSEDGWVHVAEELCIGCMMCASACPYSIPVRRPDGKMVKCDGCGGEPVCVAICPCGALTIEKD